MRLICDIEPLARIELATPSLPRKCSTPELQRHILTFGPASSGRRDSNPPPKAWKAVALPNELLPQVGRGGFEPPKS